MYEVVNFFALIVLFYRVSDCSIRVSRSWKLFYANYALKLHQNSGIILDSFAPSLFPKLFQHNSRTPTETRNPLLNGPTHNGNLGQAKLIIRFPFQDFQNSMRDVGHFSLFIMTEILRKQCKKPHQYNNVNIWKSMW